MNKSGARFTTVVACDFDQTLAATYTLAEARARRDWTECRRMAGTTSWFDGIEETLLFLAASGVVLSVASTAPMIYLEPFLERLPIQFAKIMHYGSVPKTRIEGLSLRCTIKLAQLQMLADQYALGLHIMIGDDADDFQAAALARWTFLHACWGGACDHIGGLHCKVPDDVLACVQAIQAKFTDTQLRIGLLSNSNKLLSFETFTARLLPISSLRAAYLEVYHPGQRRPADAVSEALFGFKDADAHMTSVLAALAAVAAKHVFSNSIVTHVVPVLSSSERRASPGTPIGHVAKAVATSLGAAPDYSLVSQREARSSLHKQSGGYASRRTLLNSVLTCRPANGMRIVLVDDVITTGASMSSYSELLATAGAEIIGMVALMRTARGTAYANASFFEALANRESSFRVVELA